MEGKEKETEKVEARMVKIEKERREKRGSHRQPATFTSYFMRIEQGEAIHLPVRAALLLFEAAGVVIACTGSKTLNTTLFTSPIFYPIAVCDFIVFWG